MRWVEIFEIVIFMLMLQPPQYYNYFTNIWLYLSFTHSGLSMAASAKGWQSHPE